MDSGCALTILVPCHNQGAYLRQCLDSVIAQSLKPFQVIVSDNYSTDDSSIILDSYRGHVTAVRPSRFLPVTEHFNFLLSLASSPWVTFLCADDWMKPNYIDVLARLIAKRPAACLVRGGWHCVDIDGKITSTRRLLSVPRYSPLPVNFFESIVGPKSPMIGWAVNLQKFREIGFFDPQADLLDWTAMIALSDQGAFVSTYKSIAYYRLNYRPGIQEQRIRKHLDDCFYIADNYLLPRFRLYSKRRLARPALLFVKKILSMMLQYHHFFGSDSYYVEAVQKMRRLSAVLHEDGYIRLSPREFLDQLPGEYSGV